MANLINGGEFTRTIMLHREIQEMWCWVNGPSSQLKFPITTLRILVLDIFVFFLHPYFIITNILHGVKSKGNVILRIRLALLIVNIIKDYCPPGNMVLVVVAVGMDLIVAFTGSWMAVCFIGLVVMSVTVAASKA